MTTDSWTDARIDHELVDAFALTGGDVDSPTFRAVYNRMIGLRDNLAAQLAAAQQRIVELEASRGVEPDWHISPTWAQYWAVDADGAAYWYEVEPNAKGAMGYWGKGAGRCELDPIRRSFSWLDTLRRRQAQEGAEEHAR